MRPDLGPKYSVLMYSSTFFKYLYLYSYKLWSCTRTHTHVQSTQILRVHYEYIQVLFLFLIIKSLTTTTISKSMVANCITVHSVCSKVHQRLYFLRRLRAFGVNVLFYRSIIESILHYGITVWFGNLSVQSKSQLFRLMRTAMKIQTLRRQSVKIIYQTQFYTINFSSCLLADAIELLRSSLIDTNTHLCHCPLNNSIHDACCNSVTCHS